MSDKALKRQGYPVGNDDWLVKNNTGAAIAKGDLVSITIATTLDTAEAVATANLNTIQGVALEACVNDATKSFRVCVDGICSAKVPDGTAVKGLLMAANATANLVAYATDTKAANVALALALEANASGATALRKVLFKGLSFQQFNRVT